MTRLVEFEQKSNNKKVFVNPEHVSYLSEAGSTGDTRIHFFNKEDALIVKGDPAIVARQLTGTSS